MPPITGRTAVTFVLADPIEHVRAPELMNERFRARGVDAVLVPMHVRTSDLADVVRALAATPSCPGFVVTMPHKSDMLGLVDDASEAARACGAVNVVSRRQDGRFVGDNLDGAGFVRGLASEGHELAGKRVYLAGAGGAAAAIAFAVATAGAASLSIHNRTRDKAEALLDRVRAASHGRAIHLAVADAPPDPAHHDVVVNATSLGRLPEDPLPIDPSRLVPPVVCVDILMGLDTPWLREARARGCPVQRGEPMLAHQLDRMVDLWFPVAR